MVASPLTCPVTGLPLEPARRDDVDVTFVPPRAHGYEPVGVTEQLLVRADGCAAYPVVDGIPVVRVPEQLVPVGSEHECDVRTGAYAEAYAEMDHYSSTAAGEAPGAATSTHGRAIDRVLALSPDQRASFPAPYEVWLDATYELRAQWDAFQHLTPLAGRRVLQLGGRGLQAVKLVLAGAHEAWVATPMVGELVYARALAEHAGVADRVHFVAALAEELPFAPGSMDAVYTQGCLHHWVVDRAVPELVRVLRGGGVFAAVEPWRGPFYGIGTKVLGKRDPAVQCVVLEADRIQPFLAAFEDREVRHYGALTRYPMLALSKAGVRPGRDRLWRLAEREEVLTARWPRLRDTGSSVALLSRNPSAARARSASA